MRETYEGFLESATKSADDLKKRGNRIAILRFIVFLAIGLSAYLYWEGQQIFLWIGLIELVIFVLFIKFHKRIANKRKCHLTLIEINKEELEHLSGENSEFPSGKEYTNDKHPFSSDLDIFGEQSLFQYLSRCGTKEGNKALSKLLLSTDKDYPNISARQEGVKELRSKPEWRQMLQAFGRMHGDLNQAMDQVQEWERDSTVKPNKVNRFLSILLPALFGAVTVTYFVTNLEILENFLWLLLILNMLLTGIYIKRIKEELNSSGQMSKAMTNCALILNHIQGQSFQSEVLKNHQSRIGEEPIKAIKQLAQIMGRLESLENAFGVLLMSGTMQYHVHAYFALLKWKTIHAGDVSTWFHAIGGIEALGSLANFSFNNPNYAFPTFNTKGSFEFKDLGHPLIHPEERVCNDVALGQGQLVILTGSNMSGKSTFLRTVGINLVLAKSGAPICADIGDLDPLNVFVHMKVSDSLAGGQSYFFAEVDRLKFIKENLEKENGFVLLDEILRGTNSEDKQIGTIEFLKKLRSVGATGVVATHDLSVCDLSDEFPEIMTNKCFEVEMKNDELVFDYKLRSGICQNKNATVILKKSGII